MHTASDLKPKPGDEDIACMRITSLNYILSEAIAPPDNGVLWGGYSFGIDSIACIDYNAGNR